MILSTSKTRIRRHQPGFTLVELLIVIIVIAILAAITVVAYNGVQNRAITASVQSDLTQAVKQLEAAKVSSPSELYPDSLPSEIGATNGNTLTYYHATGSKNYCLEASNAGTVYSSSSNVSTPTQASCLTNGLLGWWTFNGNANDASDHGNNGTVTNALPVAGSTGQVNTAYDFNGSNAMIRIPMNGYPATISDFTVSMWVNPNPSTTSTSVLVANPDVVTNRLNIHMPWGMNDLYWDFGSIIGGEGRINRPWDTSWSNTWAHWVFTTDAMLGMKAYRNGVVIMTGNNRSVFSPEGKTLDIGYYVSSNTYWDGIVDDLRIYQRALPQDEVLELYSAGAQ